VVPLQLTVPGEFRSRLTELVSISGLCTLTLVCVLAMENHREVEVGMGADLGCFNPQSSYVAMIHNPALLETNISLGKLQF
jgi:hypothetical protein